MGCLHDPANVQQTSSKCIQNTRIRPGVVVSLEYRFYHAVASRLRVPQTALDVC